MKNNMALGFIKPHAAPSAAIWDWIRRTLETRGIRLCAERIVTGREIREQGLIDRHYMAIARIGGGSEPGTLVLNDTALQAFQVAFGVSWEEAVKRHLLFSGMTALKQLNVTPQDLMTLWSQAKTAKIGAGFYAASLQGLYVLNGFYPSLREIYTGDKDLIRCFLMEFNGETLPWKNFRGNLVGSTDPAKAVADSLRGSLYQRRQEFNLCMNPRDNVIHASASPFEALVERSIWMPDFNLDTDPLVLALAGQDIDKSTLLAWARENPVLTLSGRTASVIDHLEDTDTPDAAAMILQLLRGGSRIPAH